MTRTPRTPTIVAAALAALLAAPPLAAEPGNTAASEPEAVGGAKAKFARVALFYSPGSGVIRSKGVIKVNKVMTGRYCIKTEMNIRNTVPDVSVEWVESTGKGLMAFWRWNPFDCPNDRRWIEVYTLSFSGNQQPFLSDKVAFTLTVP